MNPYEVEEAILKHPAVDDVGVTGAPSPHGDQIVFAAVWGLLFFAEQPDALSAVGATLIIGSTAALGRRRAVAQAGAPGGQGRAPKDGAGPGGVGAEPRGTEPGGTEPRGTEPGGTGRVGEP